MAATTPISATKVCSRCKEPKSLDEFNRCSRSKDGRRPECKSCRSSEAKIKYSLLPIEKKQARSRATTERKQKLQSEVIDYLREKGCADCGKSDPVVLEFDHVRGEKAANISHLIIAQNRKLLWSEIEKCEVVCANCHRKRTAQRGGWFKNGCHNTQYVA